MQIVTMSDMESGTIRIRNEDIPVKTGWIEQSRLKFFVDNPRIYSIVRSDGREPEQAEIYAKLRELEHVRVLKEDIRENGGLIDPIIVKDGSLEVLEGNSRLAAYRWLAENIDPNKWSKIKCTLLPADTDERLIFALLGQYHIKGKKDWVPYEKAGFLHRRFHHHKQDLPTVASELGIRQGEAEHLIKVYDFMILHHEQDRERWSYYDEYLRSKRIKKARDAYPDFDANIVAKIRSGEIKRAVDVRDDLPTICVGPAKILKRFAEGKVRFEDAHEASADAGGENGDFKKLKKFRDWIVKSETERDLVDLREKGIRDRIEYELSAIEKRIRKLRALMEQPTATA